MYWLILQRTQIMFSLSAVRSSGWRESAALFQIFYIRKWRLWNNKRLHAYTCMLTPALLSHCHPPGLQNSPLGKPIWLMPAVSDGVAYDLASETQTRFTPRIWGDYRVWNFNYSHHTTQLQTDIRVHRLKTYGELGDTRRKKEKLIKKTQNIK